MRLFFGGLIAAILLGLYVYAVYVAVTLAYNPAGGDLSFGYVLVLQTVGGLISALVIAELAVTQPGEPPVVHTAALLDRETLTAGVTQAITYIAWAYVLVWVVVGLVAFVVGTLNHPGQVQPLTDLGQAWLGLAVAAAYSYFGVKPK
jgi:hypothetical protein